MVLEESGFSGWFSSAGADLQGNIISKVGHLNKYWLRTDRPCNIQTEITASTRAETNH